MSRISLSSAESAWQPPRVISYGLKTGLFEDNKSLADATYLANPGLTKRAGSWLKSGLAAILALKAGKSPLAEGMRSYIEQRYLLKENTANFIPAKAISLPTVTPDSSISPQNRELFEAIHKIWPRLVRKTPFRSTNSLISLPHPYVVASNGRYAEMYYWDSFFTILGLNVSGLHQLAKGMVGNCLYMIDRFGHVPNGNRTYYLSRSQPPLLTSMIREVMPDKPDQWLEHAYDMAKKEYEGFWMAPVSSGGRYLPEYGLNRYDDPVGEFRPESWGTDNAKTANTPEFFRNERAECESGWDFTNRFDGRCRDFIPVDLNSLLYKYETDLAEFAAKLGRKDDETLWKNRATKRKALLEKFCYNPEDGFFYDFDTRKNERSAYKCLAGFFPMWAELFDKDLERDKIDALTKNLSQFQRPGGLVTSLHQTGKQWDAPNGWAPLQWIVADGLKRYGKEPEAQKIVDTWLSLCHRIYSKTGKFFEKYNVEEQSTQAVSDSYPMQEGFGWTNGVCLRMIRDIATPEIS